MLHLIIASQILLASDCTDAVSSYNMAAMDVTHYSQELASCMSLHGRDACSPEAENEINARQDLEAARSRLSAYGCGF